MQKRQEGQSQEVRAIALKAQQRLHGRYQVLSGDNYNPAGLCGLTHVSRIYRR